MTDLVSPGWRDVSGDAAALPEPPKAWERQPGESLRAWTAFELYLRGGHKRSLQQVADALGRKRQTVAGISSRYDWKRRIESYEHNEAEIRQRAAEASIVEMAERQVKLAMGLFGKAAKGINELKSEHLAPRDLCLMAKTALDIERWARGVMAGGDPRGEGVGGATGHHQANGSLEEEQHADWLRSFVQPEGSFLPHRMQRAAINSAARFLQLVAGIQSGKTAGSAITFWKRILGDRRALHARGETGFYWMIAPNSIVGEVMCEAFEEFAPPGEISRARGAASGRTWELRDGTRVQFRSGEHADKLVGRRIHGAWLDEFTLLKREVWVVSVRQRLATTQGWAIFSGTPRGHNWAYNEVWRRAQRGDDSYDEDYEGFTWASKDNPAIDPKEVASAKRQLPEAYFRREWEASWEAFHGQIYEEWNEKRYSLGDDLVFPEGTEFFGGIDWGFSNPGAVLIGARLPNGDWWLVDEIYEAKKLPGWWKREIAEAWRKWRVTEFYADPAEPGLIAELVDEGVPVTAAPNEVGPGIRHVASFIKQGRLLVGRACKNLLAQHKSYKWKVDSKGQTLEIPEKVNDHAVDAERYLLYGHTNRRVPGRVRGYGTAKPKSGRRR